MRKVFHGGIEDIKSPLVNVGRDNLDFGKGFYVTDIFHQAKTWALIKARFFGNSTGIISQYSFDFEKATQKYRYKRFERYDKEWLHFIIDSRSGKKVWRRFDIIEGGVANDQVIDTVEAFIAGMIDEEKALGELSKHQPNNQICILKQVIVDRYLFFEKSFNVK